MENAKPRWTEENNPAWAPQEMPLPNQAQPSNVEWGMRRQNGQRRTDAPSAWAQEMPLPNQPQGRQLSNATGGSSFTATLKFSPASGLEPVTF